MIGCSETGRVMFISRCLSSLICGVLVALHIPSKHSVVSK